MRPILALMLILAPILSCDERGSGPTHDDAPSDLGEVGYPDDGGEPVDADSTDGPQDLGACERMGRADASECPAGADTDCDAGLQFCPGAGCVDLDRDAHHCGTCQRDCYDGACRIGYCQPEIIQFQLEWGADNRSLEVGDKWLYYTWGKYDAIFETWRYAVTRLEKNPEEWPYQVGDTTQGSSLGNVVRSVRLHENYVYWLDSTDGAIQRHRNDDVSTRETIISGLTSINDYTVGMRRVFWSDPERGVLNVAAAAPNANPKVLVDDLTEPRQVATDGEFVYVLDWSETDGEARLLRISLDGAVFPLASSSGTGPLEAREGDVFWLSLARGSRRLLGVSRDGGTVRTLKSFDNRSGGDMAVGRDFVFWTTPWKDGGKITKVPRQGGEEQTVVSRETVVEVSGALEFWFKFIRDPAPGAIDVDDRYVYWIGGDTRNVFRVAK